MPKSTEIRDADLILVIEECGEVIQAATKILRFGADDGHPEHYDGAPNSVALAKEVGDLFAVIERLDLDAETVMAAFRAKDEKLKTFGPDGTYLAEKAAAARQSKGGE